MIKQLFAFLLICFTLSISNPVFAQRLPTNTKVEELSDQQIKQIQAEINARGLTIEQATQLAKAQGASQEQIDQLTKRLQEAQLSGNQPKNKKGTASSKLNQKKDSLSSKYSVRDSLTDDKVTEKNKKIFGYQLFNRDNLSFEPSVNMAIPKDYVLGIGDEVSVQVWGSSQQTYLLNVDTNGDINIPDLGPIRVANLTYEIAKKTILSRLAAIYSDMLGSNPDTFADVSINNPRAIKVNVIGETITPGTYTLPATASAFNALYLSGGPNENGSFRNIRIIRDNKLFAVIDVYDYLIHTNTANNVSLRDQDIIFVPTYDKRVETLGAFKRNGIYELKEGESVPQLLEFTGGYSEDASQSRLLITRFAEDQYKLLDVNKVAFDQFEFKNGDLVQSEKVIARFLNRVSIEGAVFRPGTYALEENMKLSQLIQKAGGLREDYFSQRGLIIRLDNQLYPTTIPFDVSDLLSETSDLLLKREDQVIINDIFNMGEKQTIHIYGEVINPEEYKFYRNMTLKDVIFLAGGLTEAASDSYLEVARRNSYEEASVITSKLVSLFQFEIDRNLKLNPEDEKFKLQPFDQIYIRKAPSYQVQRSVIIKGEVMYPGDYSISNKDERVSDLIKRAGGLTPSAYTDGARLKRYIKNELKEQLEVVKNLQEKLDTTVQVNYEDQYQDLELRLTDILKNPRSEFDYLLREGDQVTIPEKSQAVWVNGEVLKPIGLSWQPGKRADYYISLAGGFSPNAKKGSVYVINSNGTTKVSKGFIFKSYPKVEPGSQIVVPTKPERKNSDTTMWLSFVSALASLAIAAAAVFR